MKISDIKEELEQEASFWRTMLEECPNSGISETQRMREALQLAEYKLAQMMSSYH